jgi:hypothetical protein
MDLLDPAGDEILPDGLCVRGREEVLHFAVGRGGDLREHCIGIVVPSLNTLEVQDRQPTETSERPGEARIDDRVHRGREDGDRERNAAEIKGEVDVGGLDRVGAGRKRDVLEAVRRPDRVDLRAEDAT